MTKIEEMTKELLLTMDGFSPEEIEDFRKEWFEKEEPGKSRSKLVDNYLNALCDVAIERAKRKQTVSGSVEADS